MSEYKKPLPRPALESKPFWDGCKKHQLLLPHCPNCGAYWFPASITCPQCLNLRWEWTPSRGKGRIHSFGIYHRVYHKGFEPEIPYAVALIELDEGPRLVSNIAGSPPDQLRCDAPVQVVFEDVTDDTTLYKFKLIN